MGGKRGAKYYISCWRGFTGFIAPVYELSDAKLTSYRQYQTQLAIAAHPQVFYSYVCMYACAPLHGYGRGVLNSHLLGKCANSQTTA